jgi:hypothetical protein
VQVCCDENSCVAGYKRSSFKVHDNNNTGARLATGKENCTFNIVYWNCHGISNVYNLDAEQRNIFNVYSVICICETWLEDNLSSLHVLEDYNVITKVAVRNFETGRASGGMLILTKKNLRCTIVEMNNIFIFVKVENENLCAIVGLVYFKPDSVKDSIKQLEIFLENNEHTLGTMPVIVGGDWNARIGNLNQPFDDAIFHDSCLLQERVALDTVTDRSGEELVDIMERNLFHVINGRSVGDCPAQYTFINSNGRSTIDLVWVNVDGLNCIADMRVCDFVLSSDHLAVTVETEFVINRNYLLHFNVIERERLEWSVDNDIIFKRLMIESRRAELINQESETSLLYTNLIEAIREGALQSDMLKKYKDLRLFKNKPWFDLECNQLKRQVRRHYRLAKRKHYAQGNIDEYLMAKRNYKLTVKSKKTAYYDSIREKLYLVKNSREFWKAVNVYKDKKRTNNNISLESWDSFLRNKYNYTVTEPMFYQDARHPFLDKDIEDTELNRVLDRLKNRKSSGVDGVQYEFYKGLPPIWREYLRILFNKVMNSERIPAEWSCIKMFCLYKKGDITEPENYRGIALINTVVKIFTAILANRLSEWAEKSGALPECQNGFRRKRSCVDNIFVLQTLIYQQIEFYNKKMFALFVDFQAAFDSVPHMKLWHKLSQIGVSSKVIRLFSCLYRNASLTVEVGGRSTEPIPVMKGVLQGETASPLLFGLFVNDMEQYFRERGHHGIPIGGSNDIIVLMFADDIVVLADSPMDLKNKLNCLSEYCTERELTVNINKTKILPFHKGRLKKLPLFFYENKKIEIVNKYTYLGVEFSSSGRFTNFCKKTLNKGKGLGEGIIKILGKAKSDLWDSKMRLYDAVVIPALLYGAEVWGLSCEGMMEKAQLNFLKRILLLNKTTPSWAVRLETDRIQLRHVIFQRCLSWLQKILDMYDSRYPKLCFERLLEIDARRTNNVISYRDKLNWVCALKDNFHLAGINVAWEELSASRLQEIKFTLIMKHAQALKDADRQKAIDSFSCLEYKFINPNFELGEQLSLIVPMYKARCYSQLRVASQRSMYLHIEGKGTCIDCTKVCPICNLGLVENVIHFLIGCPMYHEIRERYTAKYTRNILREKDRLIVLLSNVDKEKINRVYLYTALALKIRQEILSIS